jgi:hypothetical protein
LALNNDHIIYSAEDIHRYFSGKMDAAEMHAMEKASLNDALLAEAMEGYQQSSLMDSTTGYAAIQTQLNELKDKISGRTISIKKRTNNWWKVAAAILLLVGGAYAFYRMNNKNEVTVAQKNDTIKPALPATVTSPVKDSTTNTIALVSPKAAANLKVSKVLSTNTIVPDKLNAPLNDSIATSASIAMNDKKEFNALRDEQYLTSNNKLNSDKQLAYVNRLSTKNASPQFNNQNNVTNNREAFETQSAYQNQSLLRRYKKGNSQLFLGKVTDAENNPIPYANLIINNHQQSKTDANGLFNLSSSDSLVRLDVSATNYYPQTITIDASNTAVIKLSLKKATLHKSMSDTLHQSIVQLLYNSGVEPKDGWENFRLYLVNQLSNSEYDDGRKVVGETIVQFEINRINQPCNFYFEKSIDEDVDNAIENLILTQTEWHFLPETGVPAKVRLRIVF